MRWVKCLTEKLTSAATIARATCESLAPKDNLSSAEMAPHLVIGEYGEALAGQLLERAGYRLVAANFVLPVGRNLRGAQIKAEIDLIAYEAETLCFVEVKTRRSDWYAAPEMNVDLRKQRQISRAARAYRRMFGLMNAPYRYDVISIVLAPENGEAAGAGEKRGGPRLEILRNYWVDAKFRKRCWLSEEH